LIYGSSSTFFSKMSSLTVILKQTIYAALVKCATPAPDTVLPVYETPEGARDAYIASVMAELFPEHGDVSAVVDIPVHVALPATKEEKAAAKEAAKAAKEAAKVAAAAKKEALAAAKVAKEAAKVAAPPKSPPKSPEEKAAEKAAKEAAKEAAKAAKEAAKAAKAAAPPKSPPKSPEEKAAEKAAAKAAKEAAKAASNLPKLDPTFRKALKEGDAGRAKSLEGPFLAHLNSMTPIAFNEKGAKEHVVAFLASLAAVGAGAGPAAAAAEPIDLDVVEFKGETYYVNSETKRVYVGVVDSEGVPTITRAVGYVGMADFAEMTLE
jgi:chemotaxis protein histidine kinase CheA